MEKINRKTIVCNHADYTGECERFELWGKDGLKVYPRIELFKGLFGEISNRLIDFIEIATYVYCADQLVVRCQDKVDPHGFIWRREITMIIAVQDIDFWSNPEVVKTLERLLRFLSDDRFIFKFVQLTTNHPAQTYFTFTDSRATQPKPEQVILFSGGLDSLGGAIQELICDGKQTVLVRHKSNSKHKKRYEYIENALQERSNNKAMFITINTGKDGNISHEYTQRCRSFLYFALAGSIASLLDLNNVRFYENGPISLNLPLSQQVIGGRATRTTHPQTLSYFQKLISLVTGRNFIVDNPFIDKTKSEVVQLIAKNECFDLISKSMSCAHAWQQTQEQAHCGICSQCIDRRVSIIAAGAKQYDNESDYKVDFFTEAVDNNPDYFDAENKNLLTSYFLRGKQIGSSDYSYLDFEKNYPEINDAVLYMGKSPDVAAKNIFRLYKNLASDIEIVEKYATSEPFMQRMRDIDKPISPDSLAGILTRGIRKIKDEKLENPVPQADYLFRHRGDFWESRYAGGDAKLLHNCEGARYLSKLLAAPGISFKFEDFTIKENMQEVTVASDEMTSGFQCTPVSQDAIDGKTKKECFTKLNQLKGELENAKTENNNINIEEIQEEIERIENYLAQNLKPGGKARNLNKDSKRVYDKFSRNYNTILSKIEEYDSKFATHLKESIKIGNAPIYNPKIPIKWEVVPLVNK